MQENKLTIRGELSLLLAIIINSLGVVLMLHSGSGISAISSVPYAFANVLPVITLGAWTEVFQVSLVLSLMLLSKRFVPVYLFSFVVGSAFGAMIDVHDLWIKQLPQSLTFDIIYFIISYIVICFGVALANRCQLPIQLHCYLLWRGACQPLPAANYTNRPFPARACRHYRLELCAH